MTKKTPCLSCGLPTCMHSRLAEPDPIIRCQWCGDPLNSLGGCGPCVLRIQTIKARYGEPEGREGREAVVPLPRLTLCAQRLAWRRLAREAEQMPIIHVPIEDTFRIEMAATFDATKCQSCNLPSNAFVNGLCLGCYGKYGEPTQKLEPVGPHGQTPPALTITLAQASKIAVAVGNGLKAFGPGDFVRIG